MGGCLNTFLIGLAGKARHGKNSVGDALVRKLEGRARCYSLAAALRSFCRVMGWMTEKNGPVLQIVGTDLFRQADPDVWIRTLEYQIQEEAPEIAIITDVRFPNETAWCEKNGIVVKVRRLNSNGSLFITDDRPADHLSETALDNHEFQHVVSAMTGDIGAMERQVADLLRGLKL